MNTIVQKLFSLLRGTIATLLFLVNALFTALLIIIVGLLRLALFKKNWQDCFDRVIHQLLVPAWRLFNAGILSLTSKTVFTLEGSGQLSRKGKYLLICNHQAWADIVVLQKTIGREVPAFVFFMKRQLLWNLPIIAWASWAAGYPFMQRQTKSKLKKAPHSKFKDVETTKKFCDRFRGKPLCIISYIESTRFSAEKRANQNSPFQHLLKPKAGAFAHTLSALQDNLQQIINVTIVYPTQENNSFWAFICGRIKEIKVVYEVIPITDNLRGDFSKDREFRIALQNWVNSLWKQKDELLKSYLEQSKE